MKDVDLENIDWDNLDGSKMISYIRSYGTAFIQAWRAHHPDKQLNLYGLDIGDARLAGADLSYAMLEDTDLGGADLTGANLEYAELARAFLGDVKGNEARCAHADFSGATITESEFRGADFTDAYLTGALVSGTNFSMADFSGVSLRGVAGIEQTYISDAKLSPMARAVVIAALRESWAERYDK